MEILDLGVVLTYHDRRILRAFDPTRLHQNVGATDELDVVVVAWTTIPVRVVDEVGVVVEPGMADLDVAQRSHVYLVNHSVDVHALQDEVSSHDAVGVWVRNLVVDFRIDHLESRMGATSINQANRNRSLASNARVLDRDVVSFHRDAALDVETVNDSSVFRDLEVAFEQR